MVSSKQYQILLGATFIFILGIVIAYFVALYKNTVTENDLTNNSDLRAQLEKLNKEIDELSKSHQQSNTNIPAHQVVTELTTQPTDVSSSTVYTQEDFTTAINLQYGKLAENYKNIENYNPYEAAYANYEAEPYDETWADLRADRLRNAFISEQNLKYYSVKSIDCRSKHCRVEVFYQQQDDVSSIGMEINKLKLEDNGKPLFITLSQINYNDNTKTASLYLTDDFSASIY